MSRRLLLSQYQPPSIVSLWRKYARTQVFWKRKLKSHTICLLYYSRLVFHTYYKTAVKSLPTFYISLYCRIMGIFFLLKLNQTWNIDSSMKNRWFHVWQNHTDKTVLIPIFTTYMIYKVYNDTHNKVHITIASIVRAQKMLYFSPLTYYDRLHPVFFWRQV